MSRTAGAPTPPAHDVTSGSHLLNEVMAQHLAHIKYLVLVMKKLNYNLLMIITSESNA